MTETEVYILSENALVAVISQIKGEQWGMKLPDWFQIGRTQDRDKITLKDIINYHAYDAAWVPETLAGKTIAEVGSKYDGDLLGDDPIGAYAKLADAAITAAKALTDPNKPVHLTYGDWPVKEYLKHITSFRGFRAYEIAMVIGVNPKLPDELVQGMWDQIQPEAEDWRKMGVFGPAVKVPDSADLQTKLLGLSGRQP